MFRGSMPRRAAVVMLALAAGCTNPPKNTGPTQIPPRQNPYIADVPTPAGFELNVNKSMYETYSRVRVVRHVYEGNKDPQIVRNFYVTQMPEHEWSQVNETLTEGVFSMRFKKGIEICEISVSKGNTGKFWAPVQINARIGPEQEPGATPDKEDESATPTRTQRKRTGDSD